MTYPDDCLQSLLAPDPWWEKNDSEQICRGSLIYAYIPHVDQIPYGFIPVARKSPTDHSSAEIEVVPLKVNQPLDNIPLPVAAMIKSDQEVWAAYKAKKRPCLVFGIEKANIDKCLTVGKSNHATAPTILVAPFFGIAQKGTRAGYNQAFVERVRHCEYPQFHWDIPPLSSGEESILRLDQLQPIGAHHQSIKLTNHKLTEDALALMDDMLRWLIWGGVPKESNLLLYRQFIESEFEH